jgi:type VI secretion system secreted protein VgrG
MSRSGVLQAALESTDFDVRGVDVVRLRGRERISQPFWFEVEVALRERQALPDDAAPGAAVTLILTREDHGEVTELRRVHGVIESVRDRLDAHRERRVYVLRVVPALSRLRLVETQEIFLGMNVPEIIRQKLDLHDLADTLVMHAEDYPKRELVVQYKESDLAFVSRLAEHVGVSFVF